MCTTYSGRALFPSNMGVPTLDDMGIQLGRIARFAGATTVWWSVLHHVRVGIALLEHGIVKPNTLHLNQEFFFLHDGNELATSDIPSTWKHEAIRPALDKLQNRIYLRYVGHLPGTYHARWIKEVDLLCLGAEMMVVGPPNVLQHSGIELDTLPEGMLKNATEVVREVVGRYHGPMSSAVPSGALVNWWHNKAAELFPENPKHDGLTQALIG
jgi:hypothetical protein